MARIWIAAILIVTACSSYLQGEMPSSVLPVHGQESLICFLRKEPPKECTNSTIDMTSIPSRLKQLYRKMGEGLKEYIVKGSLTKASPETFSDLHPVLFYLMPSGDKRLRAGGEALARLVRAQGGETAAIIAAAALLNNSQERDLFVNKLAGVILSERSQSVLGEYLAEWFTQGDADWKFDRFGKALRAGNPLVGSLPSPFLTYLSPLVIERFLFLLSQWESRGSTREEQWFNKGKKVARTWSHMVIKAQYPHPLANWTTLSYKRYAFLLLGFTPDELVTMAVPHKEVRANIFQLKFDKLQARAVFEAILGKGTEVKASDLKNGIPLSAVPILPLLSPIQLAYRFNHSIADFGVLHFPSSRALYDPSLATAKQMAHCLIAQSMLGRLVNSSSKSNSSSHGESSENLPTSEASAINVTFSPTPTSTSLQELKNVTMADLVNVGHFIYALQLSYIRNENIAKISPQLLKMMDSNNLSPRQGRLLTQHLVIQLEADAIMSHTVSGNRSHHVSGDELIGFGPGILRGLLSTSILSALDIRRVPQRVMQHLLSADRPWTSGVLLEESQSLRSLAILQRVRNVIEQDWVLKHILSNGASGQLLKYLTPQEVITISQPILKTAQFQTLSGLHQKTLSTLLDAAIPELQLRGPGGGKWASEGLAAGAAPLLRGLRCNHLELVDPHDVVVVLGQFNKQRLARAGVKYQLFPKHLQQCAIRALASHLKAKVALWEERGKILNFSSPELLHVLGSSDLESVGGYVIAGLPEAVLEFLGADALRLVGQLSPQELLSAVFGNHHPTDIALILLKQLGIDLDMEIKPISNQEIGPKYKIGRLGVKWLEWRGKEPSLMPLLFGSLLPFLPPDLVGPDSLRWTLETAKPGDSLICLQSSQRDHWYLVLKKAFGDPNSWTPSTLAIIGDFLLVVPQAMLQSVPMDSWANAADSLIEKSRYFAKDVDMPRGRVSYVEACIHFLGKAEQDSYNGEVKKLARYFLIAAQLQINGVTSYSDLIKTNSSTPTKGRFSQGSLVPVPGLRRPSVPTLNLVETISDDTLIERSLDTMQHKLIRKERADDESIDIKWNFVTKITCEAIRASGPEIAGASLQPEDIELMSPQEVQECIDVLGAIDLEDDLYKVVLAKIKDKMGALEMKDLGRIVGAMSEEELQTFNISITSNLDGISVLGREIPNWSWAPLLAKKILPKDLDKPLSVEDVAALGGLLCGIPEAVINQTLMPHTIFWAAPFLTSALSASPSRGCPPVQCLNTLGKLAADGLGNPSDGWSAMELAFMGILAAGLSEELWSALDKTGRKDATMSGLQISALECMPSNILKGLSTSQISQLSPLVAMALDDKQRDFLTEEQKSALQELQGNPFDNIVFPEAPKETSDSNDNNKVVVEDVKAAKEAFKASHFTVLFSVSILWGISLI